MAIVQSIAVGKAKGSAGNVTFTTQKGRVIMKEKATFVANPKTEKQQAQRNALGVAVKAWQKIGKFSKIGMTANSIYSSAYNQFVSENIELSKEIAKSNPTLLNESYNAFLVSKGNLKQVDTNVTFTSENGGKGSFTVQGFDEKMKIGDSIHLLVFVPDTEKTVLVSKTLTASNISGTDLTFQLNVGENAKSAKAKSAVFVTTADGKDSSTSFLK